MNILLDTHSLFWFLAKDKRLSNSAREAIYEADKIFVPTIVLLELLWLLEKKGLSRKFLSFLNRLKTDERYVVMSLDIAVVEAISKLLPKLETHDRIIVATAQLVNAELVTKDKSIHVVYQNIIW